MIKLKTVKNKDIFINPNHIIYIRKDVSYLDHVGTEVYLGKYGDSILVIESPEKVAEMCESWNDGDYELPSLKREELNALTLRAREGDLQAAEELLKKLSE